jgi:hypothetical protein
MICSERPMTSNESPSIFIYLKSTSKNIVGIYYSFDGAAKSALLAWHTCRQSEGLVWKEIENQTQNGIKFWESRADYAFPTPEKDVSTTMTIRHLIIEVNWNDQ